MSGGMVTIATVESVMTRSDNPDLSAKSDAAASTFRRLPNRAALAVLAQMYGYHDQDERAETVDLSYDDLAA